MFKKKRTVLGLDVGNQSVKLVELTLDKDGIALANYGIIPLPPEVEEAKKTALIITGIREILQAKGIKTKNIVFSLKGRDVIMRFLKMPLMPEKELKEVLRQEVFRISHLPKEEINWDYLLFPEKEKKELGAIVIISERKKITQFTSLIQQIPLKPISLTVTALAIWETISKLEYKEEETILSLHIDEEITTIMLLKRKTPSFVRKIYVATGTFLKDVSKKLDLGREEIENLKGELKKGVISADVKQVINPWLAQLAGEVERSLEYYRTELKVSETIRPDRLFLSGIGSQWAGVKEFFAKRLGVKSEVFDLFRILKVDSTCFDMRRLRESASLLTIATGLSLSQLAPTMAELQPEWRAKKRINLLPREKKKVVAFFQLLFRTVIPALTLFLLSLLIFTMKINLHYRREAKEKQQVLNKLEGIITTAKNEGIGGESAFIRKALGERVEWSEILKELSHITSNQVWLSNLSFGKEENSSGRSLKIEGFSSSNSSVVEFVSRLQNSSFFRDVHLKEFQKSPFRGEKMVKFVLTSELRKGL